MDADHGRSLGSLYRREPVPFLSPPRWEASGLFGAARVSQAKPLRDQLSTPGPDKDVSFIAIPLVDEPEQLIVQNGRETRIPGRRKETLFCYNLQAAPRRDLSVPFDSIALLLPNARLDEIDIFQQGRLSREMRLPSLGTADPVVVHLACSLLPALKQPAAASRLFVDQVLNAIQIHMAVTYGEVRRDVRPSTGNLAGWQVRRAQEFMTSRLSGTLALEEIAEVCQLSVSHFSRAFRRTVGVTPYHWLTSQRLAKAKRLLSTTALTTDAIALECGFSHRVSFTRTFHQMVGVSPSRWRRANQAKSLL